jgi:hypothetical protein
MVGDSAASVIGEKSLTGSYGRLLYKYGATVSAERSDITSVYPSGVALAAIPVPIVKATAG